MVVDLNIDYAEMVYEQPLTTNSCYKYEYHNDAMHVTNVINTINHMKRNHVQVTGAASCKPHTLAHVLLC